MFLTRDIHVFSFLLPSKYSTKRTLRNNSNMFLNNSYVFEFCDIGVNFNPFSNNFVSVSFNLCVDRLTICSSGLVIGCCVVVDFSIKIIPFNVRIVFSFWVWSSIECHFHELR